MKIDVNRLGHDRKPVALVNRITHSVFFPVDNRSCLMVDSRGTHLINESFDSVRKQGDVDERAVIYPGDTITITF